MTEMTAESATALRKPFPKQSVGVLPKPYKKDSPKGQCNECGGYHGLPAVHLDFVGHAAVTDRLLTVDPHWTWDFAEVDPATGFPSLRHSVDPDHNLWIRLTICGVTRIGVGDGSSMKERIGDAIRNAAMRFGVALDLWAKENLVEFAQAVRHPTPDEEAVKADLDTAPEPPPQFDYGAHPVAADAEPAMEDKTRRRMFALFGDLEIPEEKQLPGINAITGKAYESRKHLTEADARKVVRHLDQRKRQSMSKETADA